MGAAFSAVSIPAKHRAGAVAKIANIGGCKPFRPGQNCRGGSAEQRVAMIDQRIKQAWTAEKTAPRPRPDRHE